ncbi:MAG: enoyl-ACP reductase [Planctomycetia bacterium]|jgi:enoyl-[acyl-carrier protein] reductase I|nr:enoyl-ACP reductase [Planctomycetia bacterium]NDH94748.1 enoyl-ACP reductase [Planctomycetia bacterium]
MGRYEGLKGLVLGVANDHSIAWSIAKELLDGGATIGFSHLPDKPDDQRQRNRRRVALLTDPEPNAKFLVPMDVSSDDQIAAVMDKARAEFGTLDFLVHSIAYAPMEDLKGETTNCSREGFRLAMETSAYSLLAVGRLGRDLLAPNAAILTLTYFGGEKVVPGYNIMGVCKATLDACVKYMAYDLGPQGVRVNAISAGPLRTLAGRGAGVEDMLGLYQHMSPLGRNITHEEVGKAGAWLVSRDSLGITGELLHVDAGYNIMGSPGRLLDLVPKGA